VARLEVGQDEQVRAFEHRELIGERLKAAGYLFVALDVFGYRSGSMNVLLHEGTR
jgi:uncharacterized protein